MMVISNVDSSNNMNDKQISIIIPVYNASVTVARCVQSLLAQTYSNIQLILVDDASTDDSGIILNSLEQEDPDRITLIFLEKNSGPGEARNIGLQYASGDYIGFVDSDDYVAATFCERLVSELESGGHDMVDCGYYNEKTDTAMLHTGRDTRGILNDSQKCDLIASGGYLWSRLYRKELFTRYGLSFRKSYVLEDSEVLSELIARSCSIGAVEETLYWYSKSPDSMSGTRNPERYVKSIADAMTAIGNLRQRLDNYDALRPALEYEILQMYDYGIVMVLSDARSTGTLNTVKELANLRNLRNSIVTGGYDNVYVTNKIPREDIELMRSNDADPSEVASKYMKQ